MDQFNTSNFMRAACCSVLKYSRNLEIFVDEKSRGPEYC